MSSGSSSEFSASSSDSVIAIIMILKKVGDVSIEVKPKDEIELEFGSSWKPGARNILKDGNYL